jgi:hypothetical protein
LDRVGLEVHLRLFREYIRWDDRFLEVEIAACREPGALDGGTHMLAVVERLRKERVRTA